MSRITHDVETVMMQSCTIRVSTCYDVGVGEAMGLPRRTVINMNTTWRYDPAQSAWVLQISPERWIILRDDYSDPPSAQFTQNLLALIREGR